MHMLSPGFGRLVILSSWFPRSPSHPSTPHYDYPWNVYLLISLLSARWVRNLFIVYSLLLSCALDYNGYQSFSFGMLRPARLVNFFENRGETMLTRNPSPGRTETGMPRSPESVTGSVRHPRQLRVSFNLELLRWKVGRWPHPHSRRLQYLWSFNPRTTAAILSGGYEHPHENVRTAKIHWMDDGIRAFRGPSPSSS